MTITQACNYVSSRPRKRAVAQTIDQTRRRDAIRATIDKLNQNDQHALLQKIRADGKIPDAERTAILEETIRDIAIRQQYDVDKGFADAVNVILRTV